MKYLKLTLFLFFIINHTFLFSQENISSSIIEPLLKDALYREKVFIHINKTIYFSNENIWFTAYVAIDNSNAPSDYTTNLHVNLLNHNGDVIDSKNIFIQDGIGIGDFLINNNYLSGKYYIQGFTNYMQNFGLENVFIQEIEVVNPSKKVEFNQEMHTNNYDIQVFPESGYLLENVESVIGIKALINGKGFPFNGKIVNTKEEEITKFKGNEFGMSKCSFTPYKGETYTAIISINNTIQKTSLPKTHKTGIIFSLDNTDEKNLKLTFKTNKETLPSLKDESLVLLFYRNNFISNAVSLSIENNQGTTQELFFNKSKMLNGVNIVTLFRNNQPIAERKFFVDKLEEQTAILIDELKTENDSIIFKIKTIGPNFKPIVSQLSVSTLPKESKNFNENQNIKSAFLLSPYVKGEIENIAFYFKNSNPKEKEYLDLLLINQGWSTYSLEEKINKINPKEKIYFERGFTLNGTIKRFPKGYNIGIISNTDRLVAFSKINKKKEFSFENIFAYKNDSIKIALIKKSKPLVKPIHVAFNEATEVVKNYNYLTNRYYYNDIIEKKLKPSSQNKNVLSYKQYPKTELLNEIVLKTINLKKKKNIHDLEMNLASKHNVLASGFYKNKKVTKQMETIHQTLFDYFMSLGYIKPMVINNAATYFISIRNTPATLIDPSGKANPDKSFPPTIYINDMLTIPEFNIDMLQEVHMNTVDEILINKIGGGGGLSGTGGIIKIYLKKGNHQYFGEKNENLYENLMLLTGFDKATNYYKPQYNIYTTKTYNWSEIDWKNNLQTNEKGEVLIKIPTNEFSNEFQFIINGFSGGGLLFNTVYKTGTDDF